MGRGTCIAVLPDLQQEREVKMAFFTVPATSPEEAGKLLEKWTPLRRLVDETGPYLVIAELVDIIGELEEHAAGDEAERWAKCGEGLQVAKRYADEHWRDDG